MSNITFQQLSSQSAGTDVQPEVDAWVDRTCSDHMKFLIEGPQKIMKSQFCDFLSKSKSHGYSRIREMVEEKKILSVGEFRGVDYVYPTQRLMNWYSPEMKVSPPSGRFSDKNLYETFALIEWFKTIPLCTYPTHNPEIPSHTFEFLIEEGSYLPYTFEVLIGNLETKNRFRSMPQKDQLPFVNDVFRFFRKRSVYFDSFYKHEENAVKTIRLSFLYVYHPETSVDTIQKVMSNLAIFVASFNFKFSVDFIVEKMEYTAFRTKYSMVQKNSFKDRLVGASCIKINLNKYWQTSDWR